MSGLFISVLWLACWILGGALLAGEEYLRQKEIRVAGFFETLRKAATAKRTAIIVSIFLLIYVEIQIRSLQSDFAAYVAPRTVSQQQSDAADNFRRNCEAWIKRKEAENAHSHP